MSTKDNHDQMVWKDFCLSKSWYCRICGAIAEIGKRFEESLCEDCKLSLGNYESTPT